MRFSVHFPKSIVPLFLVTRSALFLYTWFGKGFARKIEIGKSYCALVRITIGRVLLSRSRRLRRLCEPHDRSSARTDEKRRTITMLYPDNVYKYIYICLPCTANSLFGHSTSFRSPLKHIIILPARYI